MIYQDFAQLCFHVERMVLLSFITGSQNSSQYQEVRDLNFPFKFDLTTGSIKNKLLGRGLDRNGSEHQQKRTVVVEDERLFKVSRFLSQLLLKAEHSGARVRVKPNLSQTTSDVYGQNVKSFSLNGRIS